MTERERQQHRLGLVLVGIAALCWSSAGLFVRGITADLMTMLFWRGLFSGTAVFVTFLVLERGRVVLTLKTLSWPALAVALLSALSMVTGIGSLRFTSVADAMVIYATVPFMTAGLAYLFIGERPSLSTLAASMVALVGVGIMLAGSEFGGSLFGKGLAVIMSLAMAAFTVVMRRHREVPMLPAMAASAWICSGICWFFAAPLAVTPQDLLLIALFGIAQNAAGLVFYTLGSRRIPAAEATLLAALEVPFTPFWVWLVLDETPATQTLIGGGIVLIALFGHIAMEFRGRPEDDPQPFQAGP